MQDDPSSPTPREPNAGQPLGGMAEPMPPLAAPGDGGKRNPFLPLFLVALVAVGGLVAYLVTRNGDVEVFGSTPAGAVTAFGDALSAEDFGSIFEAEMPGLAEASRGLPSAQNSAAGFDPSEGIPGLEVKFSDLDVEVTEFSDRLARADIVGGSVRVSLKADELPESIKSSMGGVVPPGFEFAQTFTVEQVSTGIAQASDGAIRNPFLVVVKDDQGWRVSILHTIMEGVRLTNGGPEPQPLPGPLGAEGPEALVAALQGSFERGPKDLIALLDPAEFGWLQDYVNLLPPVERGDRPFQFDAHVETEGDAGLIVIDTARFPSEDCSITSDFRTRCREVQAVYSNGCLNPGTGEPRQCLADLEAAALSLGEPYGDLYASLVPDRITVGIVERDGRWFLSLGRTLTTYTEPIRQNEDAWERWSESVQACSEQMTQSTGLFDNPLACFVGETA